MRETVVIKIERCEDGCGRETLYVNGKERMYAGPLWECPEDATLERDLLGPGDFVNLIQEIIENHNGKQIKFEYEEVEYEEPTVIINKILELEDEIVKGITELKKMINL